MDAVGAGRAVVEAIYLIVVGVVLYVVADRMLDALERRIGRRLEARGLVFFGILLALALLTFALLRHALGGEVT